MPGQIELHSAKTGAALGIGDRCDRFVSPGELQKDRRSHDGKPVKFLRMGGAGEVVHSPLISYQGFDAYFLGMGGALLATIVAIVILLILLLSRMVKP
jgi:hypothetical protein